MKYKKTYEVKQLYAKDTKYGDKILRPDRSVAIQFDKIDEYDEVWFRYAPGERKFGAFSLRSNERVVLILKENIKEVEGKKD